MEKILISLFCLTMLLGAAFFLKENPLLDRTDIFSQNRGQYVGFIRTNALLDRREVFSVNGRLQFVIRRNRLLNRDEVYPVNGGK